MNSVDMERLLRRTCCFFATVLIAAGVVMMTNANFSKRKLAKGMQNPGIAMELAQTNEDIYNVLGEPSDNSESAQNDRKTMLRLQTLDRWIFIPSYFLFFSAVGLYMVSQLRR